MDIEDGKGLNEDEQYLSDMSVDMVQEKQQRMQVDTAGWQTRGQEERCELKRFRCADLGWVQAPTRPTCVRLRGVNGVGTGGWQQARIRDTESRHVTSAAQAMSAGNERGAQEKEEELGIRADEANDSGVGKFSTQVHRQNEVSEMQVVKMAEETGRRYSIESHRWDVGNLYRAGKRMNVAHMERNYGGA